MVDLTAAVFGRLQFQKGGRTAAVFTITENSVTYVILAELGTSKWRAFWSAATDNLDEDFITILGDLGTNLVNLFSDTAPTANVNNQIGHIVQAL